MTAIANRANAPTAVNTHRIASSAGVASASSAAVATTPAPGRVSTSSAPTRADQEAGTESGVDAVSECSGVVSSTAVTT